METIERRKFLTGAALIVGGCAALTVPAVAAPIAVTALRPRPRQIPTKCSGDLLTAESWNELVSRVNDLSDALR